MFQSSNTASGSSRWQCASACSPYSASLIWNCSPSRMRRATFRITLESSTTKQVFMTVPLRLVGRMRAADGPSSRQSGRDGVRSHIKHPINVENHQQLAIEPVHAGRHPRQARVEVDRIGLPGFLGELHDLADRI